MTWEHLKTRFRIIISFWAMLFRGVPVGVVYAGNNMVPTVELNGKIDRGLERQADNFDDDNARPSPAVLYKNSELVPH